MKKTRLGASIFVVLAGLYATGCGSSSTSTPANGTQGSANPSSSNVLTVATLGDPPSLDPQSTTTNITGDDMQGVYEYLFSFGKDYKLVPMLASKYEVSPDGKLYTITLRQHVLFHNNQEMTSADVVASLQRWAQVSPIGKADVQNYGLQFAADGNYVVKIQLSKPYAQLPADLGWWYGGPAIYPESVCKESGTGPLKSFIGTGPYEFVKWVPGQYLQVKKFSKYSQSDLPTDWYSGKVSGTVDEIKYVPVPNEQTRVAGLISGQYDVAESLDPVSYQQISNNPNVVPQVVKPFGYPIIVFNKAQGVMSNVKVRQAFLAALNMNDLMLAAFGNPTFFDASASFFPKQQPQWYSTSGEQAYNQNNPSLAHQLLQEAGYQNQPIRWLVSQQFPFLYKAAQAAVPQLQKAGLNVQLVVVDWATLTQQRNDPKAYDAFFTYNSFSPEPPIGDAWLSESWPGFWKDSAKDQLVQKLSATVDINERKKIWDQIQALTYQQVPIVSLGQFYNFEAISKKVSGFEPTYSPFFYNVSLSK